MKKKFSTLSFQSLKISELFAFLSLVLPILKSYQTLNAKLKRFLEELAITMVELETAMKQSSFEEESKAILAADENRMKAIKRFRLRLESFLYSDIGIEEQAAKLIQNALREGGRITSMSMKDRSSAIHALNELFTQSPRYINALSLMEIASEWSTVWAKHEAFITEWTNRSSLMAEEKVVAPAYDVAKRARQQCDTILEYIEDLYNIEEKPEYAELMVKVNVEIDKTMSIVRMRETLAAKAREEAQKKASSGDQE